MRNRFRAFLLGLVAIGCGLTGCVSPYAYYCNDSCGGPAALSGRYGDCGTTPCASVGGPRVGPVACDDCAGPCGEDCTAAPCCGLTPFGLIRNMFTCNAGCGEIYWGEWYYDPPDACDPCNDCGDYVGPRCCPPRGWLRFWHGLHGGRFCPTGCEVGCGAPCASDCSDGTHAPACDCESSGAPTDAFYEEAGPAESYEVLEQPQVVPQAQPQPATGEVSVLRRRGTPAYSQHVPRRTVRTTYR